VISLHVPSGTQIAWYTPSNGCAVLNIISFLLVRFFLWVHRQASVIFQNFFLHRYAAQSRSRMEVS